MSLTNRLVFRNPQSAIRKSLLLLLLALAQCGDDSSSSRTGTVRIRLADAPFPYQHVRTVSMTIAQVELRQAGTSRFSTIMNDARTFDLLTLQGGATDTLGSAVLPTHSYDQVWIRITSVSLQTSDSRMFTPPVSDSLRTGFVVSITPLVQVKGNRTIDLVLDVDMSRSFIVQGDPTQSSGITGFSFIPSIRVADLATVGRITGSVKHNNRTPSTLTDDVLVRGLQVFAFQASTPDTASTVTDDSGNYTIYYLPAGSYTVAAEATDSTSAWGISGVIVTTANQTRQDVLTARR